MVSASLTHIEANSAGGEGARLVGRVFFAVTALALATGWALPLSSWFRTLACFTIFAIYILISSTGWKCGRLLRLVTAVSLAAVAYLCLCVQAPAPRLALLAWVSTSEFWVERSLGGKRRGRGGAYLLVGVACVSIVFLLSAILPVDGGVAAGERDAVGGRAFRAGFPGLAGRPVSIGLYSEGLLDWEVPAADRLGLLNSGMFGLFRKSLERYASERGGGVTELDSLSGGLLSGVDLMIFINPTGCLSRAERDDLAAYLSRGGGMLVLGDHTDIGGSLTALDAVLEHTAIRFNFDSAISLRDRWRGCLEIETHPVTSGVRDEVDMQIGTGASLEIEPPAFPIIKGRFAFSDRGDYANAGRGAHLGNCTRDAGESLGNLVLVAGEEVGNGRVLVFGDTSPFQNGAHFLSQRLIANSVGWLCGSDAGYVCDRGGALRLRPFDEIAAIDFSLNPKVSRELFTDMSMGGLANCLYRAGITPVPVYDRPVPGAKLMFLIAPTRRPGPDRVRDLMAYMRSGGAIVLAKGYTSPEPCAGLLSTLGFDILPVPLGNGDAAACVRHKEAWAMAYSGPPDTVTYASALGHPTIVTRPVGRGTFTLITDGRFLLDGNLESETRHIRENVEFMARLLDDLREDRRDLTLCDSVLAWARPH